MEYLSIRQYLRALEAYSKLETVVKWHNKNLTKTQFYILEDAMTILNEAIEDYKNNHDVQKELHNYQSDGDDDLPF